MLPEDRFFWVKGEDGQEYGPVGLAELRDWVQENRAGLGTDVRLDEPGVRWQPWQSYPELIALLAEAQVTSPVPGPPGLALAPLANRALAFALDLILIFILFTPILTALVVVYMPEWGEQLKQVFLNPQPYPYAVPEPADSQRLWVSLTLDLLIVSYMGGFIAAHGQTPAKALLRMRVVDAQGRKPGLARALLRAVAVVFSISLYFIPFTYLFMNPQRRAFHDYVAGTYVVKM